MQALDIKSDKRNFLLRVISSMLIAYFILMWIFPTIRILTVGSHEMQSLTEVIVTIIPDVFSLIILSVALYYFFRHSYNLTLFDKLFLIFWISNVILGFVLAGNFSISGRGFRLTYFPMMFYIIGKIFIDNKELFEKTILKTIVVFLLAAIAGIIIYFFFPQFQFYMIGQTGNPVSEYYIVRMTSLLWTPVVFGFLMALAAIFCYYKINTDPGKYVYFIFFLFFWVSTVLSVSRGPIIAFLITFIFISLVYRKWKIVFITLAIMLLSLLILYFSLFKDGDILTWMISSTGDTLSMDNQVSRVFLWKESWKDFLERPWGYGLGKAGETAYRYFLNSNVPAAPYTTDGWYLKLACETGVYGVLSYLFTFAVFLFMSIKSYYKTYNNILILSISFFIFISTNAIVNNCIDFHPFIIFYWLIIGFSSNFIIYRNETLG